MREALNLARLQSELVEAAYKQDQYDLDTINLIAPASPTRLKYFHNSPLRHNDIAEGLVEHRPYAGAEWFNKIESIAVQVACYIFAAEHANVQPHSVSQANQAVYQGLLTHNDKVLAMKFSDGGHLTHGADANFSGRFYNFEFYGVNEDGYIDYEAMEKKAEEYLPKLIVCGASSYPRVIDFQRFAWISRKIGAKLMADISHPAGLIAAHRHPDPFPHCDVVTLTLDKTMLGPHGGILLCKDELRPILDKAVHPGVQSSVPLRRIYEMAQALIDACTPEFNNYIDRILKNMKAFELVFQQVPGIMVSGGSDTHLMVLNTYQTLGITGKAAETILEKLGILTNRQVVPNETLKPYVASGLRLGTSWITARGFNEDESSLLAKIILDNLKTPDDPILFEQSTSILKTLCHTKRSNDVWAEEVNK